MRLFIIFTLLLSVAFLIPMIPSQAGNGELGTDVCEKLDGCFDNCAEAHGNEVHPLPCQKDCATNQGLSNAALNVCLNGEDCGPVVCPSGKECCNPLSGICVEPGGFCAFEG